MFLKRFIPIFGFVLVQSQLFAMQPEEVIVTATRSESAVEQVPSNISLLDAQQLKQTSAVHIQQALTQVPGVTMQRGNGQESLPGIRSAVLTGAGACGSVLIMESAIPVRGPSFCNINELFDTHFEQASQIEVTRGPSTAFFGSNGLTGAVNIELPIEADDFVSIELGSNSYFRAKTALGYGEEKSKGRVFLTLTDDGGYRDDSGYDQQKLSWRHQQQWLNWQLNAGLTATRLDQDTAGFIVGLDSYRDRDLARQNSDPNAFRETSSLRAWLRFARQIGENRTLQITPFVRATDMDFRLFFLPGDPLEQNKQQGIGWQSSLTTVANDNLSWTIGLDADFSDGELVQTQDAPTQGSAFLQETVPVGTHYDYQVDAIQLGLFGHVNYRINTQWDIIAGLRGERLEYDYDNRSLDGRTRDDGTECGFGGCRYSRPSDREDDFTNLSPKLELRYSPNSNLRFYVAASSSFRAPQATELYRLQREQQVADLDSVEARNLEIGLRYSSQRFNADVSIYQLDQDNVIIRDTDFFNIDGTKTTSSGIEFSFGYEFSDRWSTQITGNYVEHKYDSDQFLGDININGNDIDTAPKWQGNVFLNWQPIEALSMQLNLAHVDEYFLEPENQRVYPGHTLLNLRGRYQITNRLQASVRLTNLTDRRYAERADFTSFTNERYFPGEPRSVFAEIEYQFN